jgi:hypothetical protein
MASNEERLAILRMIEQGKISADDGTRLIQALGGDAGTLAPSGGPRAQFIRIRVTDLVTGRQKVSINLPVAIVTLGLRFVPESAGLDKQALLDAIDAGLIGQIVDVEDSEDGTHIQVYLE